MDLRQVAQGAPYNLVTSFEECLLGKFWVVQLDCGMEVYQSPEDPSLTEANPWMRLKQFCEDHEIKPVNMAFASKDLDPNKQINMDPFADAYFYTRRMRKLMAGNSNFAGYQDSAQGVGQLHKNTLKIIWEDDTGKGFEVEERQLDQHPKTATVSLIYKD